MEEQLSKVTKRQRKDLETAWKKERTDLQKQLQQSQQVLKDMQKQIVNREAPSHLTEKINVLMTENELLLNKIRELENIVDYIQLLKNELQRLRDKNSSDWNYWRKQQSDLYAQLRQQQFAKETILNKFDKLQKQVIFLFIITIYDFHSVWYRSNQVMAMIVYFVILVLVLYLWIAFRTKRLSKQVYRISVGKLSVMILNFLMELSMFEQ